MRTSAGLTRTAEGQTRGRVRLRLGAGERSGATGSSDSERLLSGQHAKYMSL